VLQRVYKQIVIGVVLCMQCAMAAGQYPVRITQQSLSSRLRRGHRRLIENTLIDI